MVEKWWENAIEAKKAFKRQSLKAFCIQWLAD
jgi:hypothetical protein